MSSDASEDSSDWSSAEELEDWNQELSDILCLFCDNSFKSIEKSFNHLKSDHKLDFIHICHKNKMDSIEYIELINYIRVNKPKSNQIEEIIGSKIHNKEEYMKPVIPEDRFLIFDIESIADNCDKSLITFSEESPKYELWSKEELIHKLNASDDRIKELELQLSQMRNLMDGNASNDEKRSAVHSTVGQLSSSEDEYYMSSYSHYSIHYEMLSDKIRTKAYEDSILMNKNFFKDKIVLDIGCGTGILSLFAAKAGAQLVVAVDQSDVIYKAIDFAIENKFDSKIKFIKSKLESIDFKGEGLPQKFDIIISEWMGYFLLFEGMLDSILYARDTLLNDSGILIPNRTTLSIAGLCDQGLHKRYVNFWDDVYGFNMSSMKSDIISEALIDNVSKDVIKTTVCVIKTLDLMNCCLEETHSFQTPFQLICTSNEPIVGIVGWFDCGFDVNHFQHKLILSTSPFTESTHWKQTIFILKKAINSKIGDKIDGFIKVKRNKRDIRSLVIQIHINGGEKQVFYLS